MDYQEFKRIFMELLQEKFEGEVDITCEQIPKNNGILWDAMILNKKGEHISPVIYIQEYFEFWKRGVTIEQLAEKILWGYEQYEPDVRMTKEIFRDYEKLKYHIYYKNVNYERNRKQLKQLPHRRILDLAMIFYYQVESSRYPATITIQKEHLEGWGISLDELEKNARKYTYLEKPAEFLTIEDLTHLEMENDGEEADEELPMYVLTNKQKQFGAGVIFYPGIMEQAANLLGDHFYILPSSIHECILIPGEGNYTREELVDMVTEINENHVDPREVLADQVYYYLKKDKKIYI